MRPSPALVCFAAAAFAAAAAGAAMRRASSRDFPRLGELQSGPFTLQDASLAVAGFRAAAADLAWIELLQYAAGDVPPGFEDAPGKPYTHLKEMCLRVVRLDPSFHRAYLYGAGMLGWFHGVERPEEAVELLQEGMRRAPEQPQFALYLAALAYKRKGDDRSMIALLESSFDQPETPSVMKAILANIRQARGENAAALRLWERILANDRDAAEHARARVKIRELHAALSRPASPKTKKR